MGPGFERDLLNHHRVGRGAEPLQDPVPGALVPHRPGDARSELHLLLEIAEGARAPELTRAPSPLARTARGDKEGEREARGRTSKAALSNGHGGSDVL